MKYILTKDGIIIKNPKPKLVAWREDANDEWKIEETGMLEGENGLCLKEEIIKQADNIEELFDELVCDERLIAKFCNVEETIKRLLSEGKTIYGSIWIEGEHEEPILKSVAKMKKKGKWILI